MRLISQVNPETISQIKFLVVPSIHIPPRVPKLLLSIAFNLPIVSLEWVEKVQKEGLSLPQEHNFFKYNSTEHLFENYIFAFPTTREIMPKQTKGSKPQPVSIEFLKQLVLQSGG